MIAGKTRANGVAALLQNWEQLDKVMQSALNSEGSAMKENQAVVDSIEGRIRVFRAELENLAQDAINSDVVKGFIDLGTKLVSLLDDLIKKGALLPTALAGLTIFATKKSGGRHKND